MVTLLCCPTTANILCGSVIHHTHPQHFDNGIETKGTWECLKPWDSMSNKESTSNKDSTSDKPDDGGDADINQVTSTEPVSTIATTTTTTTTTG